MNISLFFFIGFSTALISGIFSLLGGMILMIILLTLLSLPAAMLLSAMSQLLSNGWRAFLWRKHIRLQVLPPYVGGMVVAICIITSISFIPSKALAFTVMGILPLLAMALKPYVNFTILNKAHAFFGAIILTFMQLTAGAAGPLLDLLYVNSGFTRQQIIATKAVTQVGMHITRLFYYGTLVAIISGTFDWPDDLPVSIIIACLAGVVLGAISSVQIVNRMSDKQFKVILRTMIIIVSCYCLFRAWELWTAVPVVGV